jgi:hypothetical protein
LTGITDKTLLRASHIIPGLLLSALWDAAFDRDW